jgi:hypothetical protein
MQLLKGKDRGELTYGMVYSWYAIGFTYHVWLCATDYQDVSHQISQGHQFAHLHPV